jgi:hypothetical protein
MTELKIIKAIYYDPEIGVDKGDDVTKELLSEMRNGVLFYKGRYNDIFPDNFKTKRKKLSIEFEYRRKGGTKIYNEDEKINLPSELGEDKKPRWWERTWVQILFVLGAIASIVGLYVYFIK